MAKIIPSPLVSAITGSVGGVTFRSGRGFTAVGARNVFKAPDTGFQSGAQRSNAYLKQGWAALSTIEQDSWNQLSLQLQRGSVGNGQYPRRGYDLFLEFNWSRSVFFQTLINVAPTNYQRTVSTIPDIPTAAIFNTGLALLATTGYFPAANPRTFGWCRMGQRGKQLSAMSPWRFVVYVDYATALLNFSAAYAIVFPLPKTGQPYQWKWFVQTDDAFPLKVLGPSRLTP